MVNFYALLSFLGHTGPRAYLMTTISDAVIKERYLRFLDHLNALVAPCSCALTE